MSIPSFTKIFHNTTYPSISPLLPTLSTSGRTIFITGGSAGIGAALTSAFAQSGATKIAITGRTGSSLVATKESVEAEFPKTQVQIFVADVTDKHAVEAAFAEFGKVDVLVNNAGYLPDIVHIVSTDFAEWYKGFEVNVKGSFIVTQAFLRFLASSTHNEEHQEVIINMSTAVVHFPPLPGGSAYATSKIAATKFFECVQAENPKLRVVNLQPGVIETAMSEKTKASGIVYPLDDVSLPAGFAVWLCSPQAEFLKGRMVWSNWDVDEMMERKEEILWGDLLTLTLQGWPFAQQ